MIDRRDLLIAALALAPGGSALLALGCGGPPGVEKPLDLPDLVSAETDRIGRRWLERQPREADPRMLAAAILRQASPEVSLREAVAERIAADYAAGRLVKLDGWMLSRTAVRLCALAWLSR